MFTPIKSAALLVAAVSTMSLAAVMAPKAAFATDSTQPTAAANCTDATNASNLDVVWNGGSSITIKTKSGLPICEATTVNYSTYAMPDDYDNRGFFVDDYKTLNPTAFPQIPASETYTFDLDTNTFGTWLMNVPAPDACYNTQADLYYGDEIVAIDEEGYGLHADGSHATADANSVYGHAAQNIASQIFMADESACQPGQGGGTGETPVTPVEGGKGTGTTITTSTPTVLPDTGVDMSGKILSTVLSLVFGATSMFAIGVRSLRS